MFNTTESLQHATPIPSSVPPAKAIAQLHDHEFFIKCDPHMMDYKLIASSTDPEPKVPNDRVPEVVPVAPPKVYNVTDRVHALPAGLWDKDVVSTYEFFNLERGVFVRTRSPMSTTLETVWTIRETEDGGFEMVEDVVIKCSRLLVGVVRNACETGWKGIHAKMVKKMEEA